MGCVRKLSSADRMLKLLVLLLQSSANVFIVVMMVMMMMISCSLEKGIASEAHYHTLPLTSMLPPLVCNPTTSKGPGRKASMNVVHRFGPCSGRGGDSPTIKEILLRDQSRVESIQARLRSLNNNNGQMGAGESETVDLPAVHPGGGGNYIVTVGLGTPPKKVELVFDTGSHLTWTQCEPCAVQCYKQRLPRFDPAASTTYSNLSCNSQACSDLKFATYPGKCDYSTSTCFYKASYGDKSQSIGELATDKLTLTSTDVVDGFIFGCGQNNYFTYGGDNGGLMGLGTASLSIVSQTSQQFGNYFSYCLPTPTGSDGHLTFGKNNENTNNLNYTPFLTSSTNDAFYFIEVLGISVNGQPLSISPTLFQNPDTFIDSGTVITRLPTPAYNALRDAFKQQMTMYPLIQNPSSKMLFDTCYDFTNYPNPTIPTISFTFGGNLVVDLDPRGVMVPVLDNGSEVCLAFANYSTNGGIFGNYQQQTFEVVYDVAGGQLGFASGGCS
nr:aspartyl protease family protein At5g10770-like [Ipomoea batatas]